MYDRALAVRLVGNRSSNRSLSMSYTLVACRLAGPVRARQVAPKPTIVSP
jgi:hypothetical protein